MGVAVSAVSLSAHSAQADDNAATPSPQASQAAGANSAASSAPSSGGQKLNVEGLRQKYWAKGEDPELRVVQNRLYSKAGKLSLGVFGALVNGDPFLSIQALGGSLDYYFNEYFGIGVVGWKAYTTGSAALTQLQSIQQSSGGNANANTNFVKAFYGADVKASLIYGKLSLVGKAIIYYDLYLTGGAGSISTESGNYIGPTFGIGQQIYLSQHFALNFAYTGFVYSEYLPDKIDGTPSVLSSSTRSNFTSIITGGINILIGG